MIGGVIEDSRAIEIIMSSADQTCIDQFKACGPDRSRCTGATCILPLVVINHEHLIRGGGYVRHLATAVLLIIDILIIQHTTGRLPVRPLEKCTETTTRSPAIFAGCRLGTRRPDSLTKARSNSTR